MAATTRKAAAEFVKTAARLMEPLDGWTLFVESSGGWCWSHDTERLAVYASPFWDDCAGIPVDFGDRDGDSYASVFVPFDLTGDLAADVAAYRAAVRPYLALRPGQDALGRCPELPADE